MDGVTSLRVDEWERLRAIRLRALADTPDAFGTLLADALAFSDDQWQQQARDMTTFVVVDAGADLAMVRCGADREAGEGWVLSVWCAPEARGRGFGGQGGLSVACRCVTNWISHRRTDASCRRLGSAAKASSTNA
jgi:hypothetical protein